MIEGKEIIKLAKKHIGEKYVLGIIAPKDQAEYKGPFDCAEFCSYIVFQLTGRLYGCANDNGNPRGADAYSGFWGRDAEVLGTQITINEAYQTEGAAVYRKAGDGLIGHIVFSDGKGGTVEANSTKTGVIASKLTNRRWDFGILVPWIKYTQNNIADVDVINKKPKDVIYRLTFPYMVDPFIKNIQKKLKIKADGVFGPNTFNAVKTYQIMNGLVPDGEVGPKTLKLLGL